MVSSSPTGEEGQPTTLAARRERWWEQGVEPDYRFSLANERTFLAWIRTALSLLAGGVLMEQFAGSAHPRGFLVALAIGLAVLASVLCGIAYAKWRANEIAMRHGRALPGSVAVPLVSGVLVLAAALIAAMELVPT
jgi:putative membrane protein